MAKYTLLDMVQIILSAMDSDEVNSIEDTTESMQVAQVVRQSYDNLVALIDLPEHYTLFELNASADPTKPVLMDLPDNIKEVIWVQYNQSETEGGDPVFRPIKYLCIEDYINMVSTREPSRTEVDQMTLDIDGSSIDFNYYNDRYPEYYTTYNDHTLVFDAYNSTIETTLQKNKTLCYGVKSAIFTMEDSFTPLLDDRQFTLLLNDAKALAFAELKQTQHARAEKVVRESRIKLQRNKTAIEPNNQIKRRYNYGRK